MRVNLPLEIRQNESSIIRLRGLKNIYSPFAQILFQVKENSYSQKILISIEAFPSDIGADWEHEEIVIRIPPAMTRGLKASVYEWDLLVNRQGEFEYPYWGTFTLVGTISRNNESVDPVFINDLETRLAGTTMGRGSWMIGVFSNYWLEKLGGIGNIVLEKCLEWLDQNKIGILNPYTGSKILKSGISAAQIQESGIEIDSDDNISGARSLSLLLAPSLDSHATRRDWVIALVEAAISQAKSDLINGAPNILDTLQEISSALNNDPNFANTIINSLSAKADLVNGKIPLSQLPALVATDWNEIQNKPNSFPPTSHTHDDLYYTESEINTFLISKQSTTEKGTANGYASLDGTGKVPSAQLPVPSVSIPDPITQDLNLQTGKKLRHNGIPVAGWLDDGTPFYKRSIVITIPVASTTVFDFPHTIPGNIATLDKILELSYVSPTATSTIWRVDPTSQFTIQYITVFDTTFRVATGANPASARNYKIMITYK